MSPKPNRPPSGFTLVELLMVIGIMALIMAAAIPAFNGLTRGAGIQSAIKELRSTMSLARQFAITHREKTYVVFPGLDNNIYDDEPQTVSLALRGYAVYGERSGYVGEWKELPAGVYFVPADNPIDHPFGSQVNENKSIFREDRSGQTYTLPFPRMTNNVQTLNSLGFKPDGRVVGPATNMELYLGEGFMDIDLQGGDINGGDFRDNSQLFSIDIYMNTGGLRVRNYSDAN